MNKLRLNQVRIVLLQTYHPGNIGAVARAMKTMGLSDLVLVSPKKYPDLEATNRAAGAVDVLESAVVVDSLEDAIADCKQVFGTTARLQREFSRPLLSCEQAVSWVSENSTAQAKVAIVFGRERMGLTQADIEQCQQLLYIEGNPEYDVLNMASAVQIVCYELFRQLKNVQAPTQQVTDEKDLANQLDLQRFHQHLESTLLKIGFINKKHPGDVMAKFKQLFARAQLKGKEISMLRGVLASVDWHLNKDK